MAEEKRVIELPEEDRQRLRRIADIIGAVHDPEADPRFHEDDARFLRSLADRPQGGDASAAGPEVGTESTDVAGGRAGDGSAPGTSLHRIKPHEESKALMQASQRADRTRAPYLSSRSAAEIVQTLNEAGYCIVPTDIAGLSETQQRNDNSPIGAKTGLVDGLVEALEHAQEIVGAESVSADEEVRLLDHISEALANYRNQQVEEAEHA